MIELVAFGSLDMKGIYLKKKKKETVLKMTLVFGV